MKIISVVGARPNFMKIAPFCHEIQAHNSKYVEKITHLLVHTGQHYDDRMSESFFKSLDIPNADINLNIGSGSHGEQVGLTMIAFEKLLLKEMPDWVIVVGDVNATLACSIAAKKLKIRVCHIEAGLRSGDIHMPEEINRLVTDRISDLLLTPDLMSSANLVAEGVLPKKVVFVGNIMIDTLEKHKAKADGLDLNEIIFNNNVKGKFIFNADTEFALITLHRPSNVDDEVALRNLVSFFTEELSNDMQIIWTVHPRAEKQLRAFKLWDKIMLNDRITLLHPLTYHDMLKMNISARILITDSGGLQEECTVLGTPCLTLRSNTERPVTLKEHGGASVLVGNDIEIIRREYRQVLKENILPISPEFWDGKTASRCLNAILNYESTNCL